jgi:hypothetical protein
MEYQGDSDYICGLVTIRGHFIESILSLKNMQYDDIDLFLEFVSHTVTQEKLPPHKNIKMIYKKIIKSEEWKKIIKCLGYCFIELSPKYSTKKYRRKSVSLTLVDHNIERKIKKKYRKKSKNLVLSIGEKKNADLVFVNKISILRDLHFIVSFSLENKSFTIYSFGSLLAIQTEKNSDYDYLNPNGFYGGKSYRLGEKVNVVINKQINVKIKS